MKTDERQFLDSTYWITDEYPNCSIDSVALKFCSIAISHGTEEV